MSKSEVFGVILVGVVIQTLSFRYIGRVMENRSLAGVSAAALLLRALSYIGVGIFALFLAQPLFVIPVLIFYPLGAGVAFAAYYTASNTMIFNSIKKDNPGSSLGVYSAIVGFATLVGSTIPVFASVYLGFHVIFISSGLLLILAAAIMLRLRRDEGPRETHKRES
jgi:MFS family permease